MLLPAVGAVPYGAQYMQLSVDSYENQVACGCFYSTLREGVLTFSSMAGVLIYMDDLLDAARLAQRHEERRTFIPVEQTALQLAENYPEGQGAPGALATFLILVQFRHHATWQGEVTWVEQKEKRMFRSVWELVRMMDDVLTRCAEDCAASV